MIAPTITADAFDALVADLDQPTRVRRLSRAAERREGRQAIALQLGIRRHRTGEREQ
jgi:hypothetical protein